jgi:hypothetical protein
MGGQYVALLNDLTVDFHIFRRTIWQKEPVTLQQDINGSNNCAFACPKANVFSVCPESLTLPYIITCHAQKQEEQHAC